MRVKSNGDCRKLVHEDSMEYGVGLSQTNDDWFIRLTVAKVFSDEAGNKLRSDPLEFLIKVDAAIDLRRELASQIKLLRTI